MWDFWKTLFQNQPWFDIFAERTLFWYADTSRSKGCLTCETCQSSHPREISDHGNGGWGSGKVDNVRLVPWGQKLHSLLSLQVRQLLLDAALLEADEVVQPRGRSNLGDLCIKNDWRRRRRRRGTTTTKTTTTTKWFNLIVDPAWVISA